MKTVSGKVVSSQQISLSKAAKYLSKFTASDNEASPAFAAYLRRTSAAFDDLVQKHKEYKMPVAEFKDRKERSAGIVTEGTANSVKTARVDGLLASKRQNASEGMHSAGVVTEGTANSVKTARGDGLLASEIQNTSEGMQRDGVNLDVASIKMGSFDSGRSNDGNVADVGGVLKKPKKKKGRGGDLPISTTDQAGGDLDAIKGDDALFEMGSPIESEEVKENVPDVGRKSKKKRGGDDAKVKPDGVYDAINVLEGKDEMGSLDASQEMKNNVPDVGAVGKKSKKKRGSDGDVAIVDRDQSHDRIHTNDVKNEMNSPDASEGLKKKRKKRDRREKENHDGAFETVQEKQALPHRQEDGVGKATDFLQNNGEKQKKLKKKSKGKETKESNSVRIEGMESGSIRSSEHTSVRNVENISEVSDEKKQSSGAEAAENGRTIEIEATEKKASKKRKHESVADGEFVGSQEAVRSKKKKYKQ